jgi:hypothetical protein
LLQYLRRTYPTRRFDVVPLEDGIGGSAEPGVDVLVVSEETVAGARRVNRVRRRRHLPPVRVVVVRLRLAPDLRAVSSRQIRAGLLSVRGRRLRPVVVEVFGGSEPERAAVQQGFSSAMPGTRLTVRRLKARAAAREDPWDYRIRLPVRGDSRGEVDLVSPEGRVGRFRRPQVPDGLRPAIVRALRPRQRRLARQRLS